MTEGRDVGPTHPELRSELLQRFERDQQACKALVPDLTNEASNARLDEIKRDNTEWMKRLVTAHGWPGWRMVGVDGAHAAWLIVQHADHDVPFQRDCLAKLGAAVQSNDADPGSWAYLVDRVAVNEGRNQVYGTQFDDRREPRPIEDAEHVDDRRRSVGLEPLADYRRLMWERYGPPNS